MDIQNLHEHLDSRLDRIEGKLDNHLERISKAEASIEWMRGHVRIVTTGLLTLLSGLATAAYHLLTK